MATEKCENVQHPCGEDEDRSHEELVSKLALKAIHEAVENERARRIAEEGTFKEDAVRSKAYDQLIQVQEDLISCLNKMKVREMEDTEQMQRITEEKKVAVHEELIRKATAKKIHQDEEVERNRRIAECDDGGASDSKERQLTYDRLVVVQEDLLRTIRRMQADEQVKLEREYYDVGLKRELVQESMMREVHKRQSKVAEEEERQRRVQDMETASGDAQTQHAVHDRMAVVEEELLHKVGLRTTRLEEEEEKTRRVAELTHLSDEAVKQRIIFANRLLDVQKELISTHPPIKPIAGSLSHQVLEDCKVHMQEQLLRRARQKDADLVMEEERERRIKEGIQPAKGYLSLLKSDILTEINRNASIKQAKEMADAQQLEYVMADKKVHLQEDMIRKIHQKEADEAMDEEQQKRITELSHKETPHIATELKKEILEHPLSPKLRDE